MQEEIKEAVQQARKLEIDGADYYTQLAKSCESDAAARMFHSFAGDEKRHLKIVEDLAEGVGVDVDSLPMPRDEIRTLFSEASETGAQTARATEDEKQAVSKAMQMETKSFKLYTDTAENAGDEATRRLFQRLAHEENQHYEMLENTLEYMNSNDQWFLWKEWALIVGDQSSLGLG